jgi:hypothetical protein
MTDFDLEQRIESGYYNTKKPYALSQEQFDAFQAEIHALDNIALTVLDRELKKKKIIERKKQAIKELQREYHADRNRLLDEFQLDCEHWHNFASFPPVIKRKIHGMVESTEGLKNKSDKYDELVELASQCIKTMREVIDLESKSPSNEEKQC